MRFLILTQYFPPEIGAPQIRLAALLRELTSLGHQVEVVTALPNYPTGRIFPEYRGRYYVREEAVNGGEAVHRVWLYAATGGGAKRLLNYTSFTLTSLWGLGRSRRPDYVFVESPPLFLAIPGFVATRLWGSRMIFNVADPWPDTVRALGLIPDGWMMRWAERLERWSYRVADRVTAVTEGVRSTLIQNKGVPPSKVLFLPNGVDPVLFRPRPPDVELARTLGLEGKNVALYAGTHGYVHGLEIILDAAKALSSRNDIQFVLVGGGSEKPRLVERAVQDGLNNILFLDPSPPEFVARLCSLAVTGLALVRGMAHFQAFRVSKVLPLMASGVPVIHSSTGESARLVEEADSGLIIPSENPQALAEAVVRLVDDPAMARRLGRNGRRYVEQNLTWSALIRDWLEQLIGDGDPRRPAGPAAARAGGASSVGDPVRQPG